MRRSTPAWPKTLPSELGASLRARHGPACYAWAVVSKVLAAIAIFAVAARVFVRRDSEIARRFRIFVNVSLLAILVLYATRLVQLYVI